MAFLFTFMAGMHFTIGLVYTGEMRWGAVAFHAVFTLLDLVIALERTRPRTR